MEPTEFKVGVKFKYIGTGLYYLLEANTEQEVSEADESVYCTNGNFFSADSDYAKSCVLISEPENLYSKAEVEELREKAFDWGFSAGFNTEDIAGIAEYKKWRYGLFQKANPL